MEQTSTSSDLIRYIYNETSTAENEEIEQRLTRQPELREELEELRQVKQCLNKNTLKPDRSTLNTVLNYARNLN